VSENGVYLQKGHLQNGVPIMIWDFQVPHFKTKPHQQLLCFFPHFANGTEVDAIRQADILCPMSILASQNFSGWRYRESQTHLNLIPGTTRHVLRVLQIRFVQVLLAKKGAPFHETSPMLYDITSVAHLVPSRPNPWSKKHPWASRGVHSSMLSPIAIRYQIGNARTQLSCHEFTSSPCVVDGYRQQKPRPVLWSPGWEEWWRCGGRRSWGSSQSFSTSSSVQPCNGQQGPQLRQVVLDWGGYPLVN
jgi:hypothetical protein